MGDLFEDRQLEALPCLAGSVVGGGLKTVQLTPAGEVNSKNGTFIVDAESIRMVVEAFEKHGADLPIDFEHQTLGDTYAAPNGRAPAAGWIKKLWGDPGRGLMAFVTWNVQARDMIRAGEYAYISPVLMIRKSDRRVAQVHSAGLTNKPAIGGMERLAASARPMTEETEQMANEDGAGSADPAFMLGRIATALGIKSDGVDAAGGYDTLFKAILKAAERLAAGQETASMSAPEGGVATDLLRQIATLLGIKANTAVEVLQAVLKKLQGGDGGEDNDAAEVASSVRDRLGLADDAGAAEVVVAMSALESRGEATVQADALERTAEARVDGYIKTGRINPNDGPAVEAAMSLARERPERLEALMANAADIRPPQGLTTPPPAKTVKRGQVVRTAVLAFRDDEALQRQTSMEAFTNLALHDASLPKLGEGELATFV